VSLLSVSTYPSHFRGLRQSPRWLFARGRNAEALEVLAKYHGEGDPNSPIVRLEMREMLEEITLEGSDKRWWDYRDLFNSREALWRQSCVIGMSFFSQWAGNDAISYFMPVMLQQAGINDTNQQLVITAGTSIVGLGGAIVGTILVDRVGRRPLLIISSALFCLWFTIMAILQSLYTGTDNGNSNTTGGEPVNISATNAIIACIYLFGFTYAVGFTPLSALYPVECLRFENRAKGMAVAGLFVGITEFFNTFVTPIGLGSVGWKFYFLYIAWDAFQTVFIYFIFPETKNRTLEEINEIFKSSHLLSDALTTGAYPRNASFKKREFPSEYEKSPENTRSVEHAT
jgi:MFS family permease